MTRRHLKIFISVCSNDFNTTKAAEKLFMTQPAVSLAIKELESYYGVALFDRISRRLRITEAGKRFYAYALRILALFDELEKSMKDWDAHGVLRIGASITIGSQFLPTYVRQFGERFPETEVLGTVGQSSWLEGKLLNNELDFALIEGIAHSSALVAEPYMEDPLTVVCPAGGAFREGQVLSAEAFCRQRFLLREHGSGTRETFERVMEEAGFSVEPAWEAMSTTALLNAVISGLGIAVLPRRMLEGPLRRGLVVTVEVEGLQFRRNFYVVYPKGKYLTASARAFIEMCRAGEPDCPGFTGLY